MLEGVLRYVLSVRKINRDCEDSRDSVPLEARNTVERRCGLSCRIGGNNRWRFRWQFACFHLRNKVICFSQTMISIYLMRR